MGKVFPFREKVLSVTGKVFSVRQGTPAGMEKI